MLFNESALSSFIWESVVGREGLYGNITTGISHIYVIYFISSKRMSIKLMNTMRRLCTILHMHE